MTRRLRLTPENQLQRLYEDSERVEQRRQTDFSIGEHIALLIKRVDALERRASVDRSGEAGETRSGSTEGESAVPATPGDAPQTPPSESPL